MGGITIITAESGKGESNSNSVSYLFGDTVSGSHPHKINNYLGSISSNFLGFLITFSKAAFVVKY